MTQPTKRLFLDFDNTLYNTSAMMVSVQKDMQALGAKKEDIERIQKQLSTEGYSFERHLTLLGFPPETIAQRIHVYEQWLTTGDQFLYPYVAEGMARISKIAECHLLTFGFPPYQKQKVHGTGSLHHHFTDQHYVWHDVTKGEVISRYHDHTDTYFLDDSSAYLEDVRQKAPWVTCVRMEWPDKKNTPHPHDEKEWRVIHSFEEFIPIVEGSI